MAFVWGSFAAFGAVCALWTIFGWLCSGGGGTVAVLGSPMLARRLKLLREWGLFRGRVVYVCQTQDAAAALPDMETIEPAALFGAPETGGNAFGAAGTGNTAGYGGLGGLPEL